ncbi:MAG: Clp protease N-terminal domain-containing protein [Pseudonocardiaceae bacterium]
MVSLAAAKAAEWGHSYVGVEHLLLAIIDEEDSVASLAIERAGVTQRLRRELIALMESENYNEPGRHDMPTA